MKLNHKLCEKSSRETHGPKLWDGYGLYLELHKNGRKYWRLKYRYNGKEKRLALGVFPEISLKDARSKRDELRKLLDAGKDPSLERRKMKALAMRDSENTFEKVARDWFDNRKSMWRPRYADEIINRLEKDIFPHIGAYPIKEIEPQILLEVIRKIEKRGAYELAMRQKQVCGQIFRFGIAEGKALRDPSQDITEAIKPHKVKHFAALDVRELPEFLKVLDRNDARLYQSTRNALNLIMLTFVRTNELINARWEEINYDRSEWVIPAERMKMGKEHIVPLSRQALVILEDQKIIAGHWPLIFPSSVKPQKSISNNTILGALKRLGYQGRMTGHGFRALAMSGIKQELDWRHEVIDRQLAHVPKNKIVRAYDRAEFLDDRRKMMQEWADYIDNQRNAHGEQEATSGNFKQP